MGENVVGACMNSDWPNNGNGLPTESATICSNSVSGRTGVCGCQICDGFSGGLPGMYWSELKPPGFVRVGVRMEGDELSPVCPSLSLWVCAELHCALFAVDGSEQSTVVP